MDTIDAQYRVRVASGEEFGPVDVEGLRQWAREGRVPRDATVIVEGTGEALPVTYVPEIAPLVLAPPTVSSGVGVGAEGVPETYSGVVPYRNAPALLAYYAGLFSLLPFFGILLGIAGLTLGIIGLVKRSKQPEIKGTAHAWIGVILGGLMTLVWAVAIVLISVDV